MDPNGPAMTELKEHMAKCEQISNDFSQPGRNKFRVGVAGRDDITVEAHNCVVKDGMFQLMTDAKEVVAGFPVHTTRYVINETFIATAE